MTTTQTANTSCRPWLIVALSFFALALTYSSRAVFALVMPLWEKELDWSRTFTSGTMATALIVMALIAPAAGRLVDRQGSRAVMLMGLAALAAGCFLVALTAHPVAFVLAFGGIAGIGFGLIATHVVSTAVEQEFTVNQGFATGIATSGATAGQFIIVPLLALLLSEWSWQWAFVVLGAAALVMMVNIWRWFPASEPKMAAHAERHAQSSSFYDDLSFILKKPAFQILFWSYFICGYTTAGVIETHFLPYATFCGFAPVPSATAYGLLSAVNFAGMIAVGWLTDRVNRPLLLGTIYILRGLAFIMLVHVGASIETLFLFALLFGLVDYSTVPVTASLVATHIGLRVMGLAFGLISAGHQFGAALGAYLGGVLFDIYARYDWVWWSSLWLAVFAGFIVFVLRERPLAEAPA